ncbi:MULTISPECIES: GNAT family N-acetyltransferase [Methylobacterium]|uniref:GNAT family N-acetyltransferase n=1 Tax=Methylobacterium TaxID=407 RepID=UPI002E2F099F|nr:GNAT family N-acetyltransferase [Methylobacterium ajmalii]
MTRRPFACTASTCWSGRARSSPWSRRSSGPDHLWVQNLAVSPAHHGQGLGRAMLRRAEDVARSLGHGAIKLVTNPAFAGNVEFYRRAGFVVEREEPFRGGVAVHLAKTL